MPVYTYYGNRVAGDTTAALQITSGVVGIGEYGDFTDAEYRLLNQRYDLREGIVSPAPPPSFPLVPGHSASGGASISFTVGRMFSGPIEPTNDVGSAGDFYIESPEAGVGRLYGPKSSFWPAPIELGGSEGGAMRSRVEAIDLGTDWSNGDLVLVEAARVGNVGKKVDIRHGTSTVPVTSQGSTVRISRTEGIRQSDHDSWAGYSRGGQTTDTGALGISVLGTEGSEMQVEAIAAFAQNKGIRGAPDACAVWTMAWQRHPGAIGRAIGGCSASRSSLFEGAGATGWEYQVQNDTGVYSEASNEGVSKFVGLLVSGGSQAYYGGGVGINFHHPSLWAKLDVGILASSNDGGPITKAFIRDNSSAEVSLDVRGRHDYSLAILDTREREIVTYNAGRVGIGERPGVGARMLVRATDDDQAPFICKANSSTQRSGLFACQSYNGTTQFSIGATGNIVPRDGANMIIGTSTGTKIGTAPDQKIGFWGKEAVVQPGPYTVRNNTPVRELDETDVTFTTLANFVGTMASDLMRTGIFG